MGEAREVLDRMTAAVFGGDEEALKQLYAEDAVAETPDEGTVTGREAVARWSLDFLSAFPDAKFESVAEHESGNVAIDEGFVVGTNTGPLITPEGEMPPTGKSIRLRACDVATVENGQVKSHHFYFDQMEFLTQLGLAPQEEPAAG